MSKVIDMVEEHITKAVAELGYEIIEITYKKYLGDMNLTIFIDKDGGVDLNGCELVHRTIDPILDEIDPTSGEKYILNVSSPGIDRPLKVERDYKRNLDKVLKGYDLQKGLIDLDYNGKEINLDIKNIALIKPEIKF